jgi:hypothetical protein
MPAAVRRMAFLAVLAASVAAAQAVDPRHCGQPARDAHGRIVRSHATIDQFRALWPCPSTGKRTGPCPHWAIDHTIPLACGGCDVVGNMQWLPDSIKSARGPIAKDRWERRVYCPTNRKDHHE